MSPAGFPHLKFGPLARALTFLLLLCSPAAWAQTPCGPIGVANWCANQDSPGVDGGAEASDRFGAALAWGDFNGDGFDDLAVGIPGENNGAGFVDVFYSNGNTLTTNGQQLFSQDQTGGADEGSENGDEFGAALASGDFNHDGFDDLAVGSPGEDLPELFAANCTLFTCEDAGAIHVIYGSATGLQLASAQFFGEAELDTELPGRNEGARFGSSLASGDWNANSVDDLAVGAPQAGANTAGIIDSGAVYIGFGSSGGINSNANGSRFFPADAACDGDGGERLGTTLLSGHLTADNRAGLLASGATCTLSGLSGTGTVFLSTPGNTAPSLQYAQTQFSTAGNGANDHFGASLAAADFNGDGLDDLAAGAPNKNHGAGNPNDSGRVYVAYSSAAGPDPANGPDIIGEDEWAGQTPAANEHFGAALAAGKVTRDAFADLLMGAPGEGANGGFLFLKKGSATGLTTDGNQVISQGFLGGTTEAGDLFGSVLALGDVNGDGILEVAIGVPDKDVGTATDAGMVYVTHYFDASFVFTDGFESGDTSAWALTSP
ncbi:MAG: hypothetical protein U0002_18970 [Thermoanaerobaculia bacterium]